MFKDKPMFDRWLMNVAGSLKLNGYFIGCCFDGDTVANKLMKLNEDDTLYGKIEDGIVWSIKKKYDDSQTGILSDKEDGLGKAIDVYFSSIGETYTEYLMSFPYLQQRLQEIGCELLGREDLDRMGLENSTATFDVSNQMAKVSGKSFSMHPTLRTYSNLHRWFIFKRVRLDIKSPRPATVRPSLSIKEIEEPADAPVHIGKDPVESFDLIDLATLPDTLSVEPPIELAAETAPATPPAAAGGSGAAPASAEDASVELASAELASAELASVEDAPAIPAAAGGSGAAPPPTTPVLAVVTGPILRFHQGSPEKDDLKLKQKDWARYLSTYYPFEFKDRTNPSITYPNLEATLAAEKYKSASNKPDLGSTLFGSHGTLHQEFLAKKDEEEGTEIRKRSTPAEMKKKGAVFDKEKWDSVKAPILQTYVQQRFASDEKFRMILEKVRETGTRLAFYTKGSSDLSGIIEGDRIVGENIYGRALMALVGTTY
jgi:predicted NAD-dependent protein-ADP-ribosyltransferase YbiA (DUF1768 family)